MRIKKNDMEKKEPDKLNIDHTQYSTRISASFAGRKPYAPEKPGLICSFIPGTIIEVLVKEGDSVSKGDDIVILDAMKMKNRLKSHTDGIVRSINVKPGDKVTKKAVLVEII